MKREPNQDYLVTSIQSVVEHHDHHPTVPVAHVGNSCGIMNLDKPWLLPLGHDDPVMASMAAPSGVAGFPRGSRKSAFFRTFSGEPNCKTRLAATPAFRAVAADSVPRL